MLSLRRSIMAASVVLLPEPVEPTTSSRPRFCKIKSPKNFWQLQRCQAGHVLRDKANDHGDGAALVHGTDTETAHALQGTPMLSSPVSWRVSISRGGDDLGEQRARAIDRQQLAIDGNAFAVDFDEDGGVDRQVNVRSFFIGH